MEARQTHFIFYYPFSYRQHHFEKFQQTLKENHYYHFQIEQQEFRDTLYGPDVKISYDLLSQFYYPFIEEKILNDEISLVRFNRFSKIFSLSGEMNSNFEKLNFTIHSVDINLCPFGIGIMGIRIQLDNIENVTSPPSFAHYFRVLRPIIDEELGATFTIANNEFLNTEDVLFKQLAPFLEKYFVDYSSLGKNIKKMPFFEDERMYVSAFIQLDETTNIDETLLYRAGQLNGWDTIGQPYISSTNEHYIEKFVEEHCYDRWGPNFYVMTTLQGHIQLTNSPDNLAKYLSNFHSTSYYTVIIHYFYKLMLLKVAFEHSELKFSKDKEIVEDLIEQITKFATRYYFSEVSVRTEGKEIAEFFRRVFHIDEQYREIKETLDELYRVQEDRASNRLNELLFILTIFSMISGIYGMNLVIELLGEPLDWSSINSFTLFEWIAFIVTLVGITISALLVISQLRNFLTSYFERKRRKQQQ